MHAAVGGEAHQVQLLAALFHVVVCRFNLRILQELMLAAGDIDLHQVLVYHAAGTQIHVAHLGVAHLTVRKTYIFTAGLQMAARVFCA